METQAATEAPGHRRSLVIGSRMALLMLAIAAVALLGLGLAVLVLGDPPEASGWLRSIFGQVFGRMAIVIAAILGIPAAIGVWAMSGATKPEAVPALSARVHRLATGLAIVTLALAALCLLALGSGVKLLDIAFVGLVALPTLGLAGAVRYSPHRGRALAAALALLLLAAGMGWGLYQAYTLLGR